MKVKKNLAAFFLFAFGAAGFAQSGETFSGEDFVIPYPESITKKTAGRNIEYDVGSYLDVHGYSKTEFPRFFVSVGLNPEKNPLDLGFSVKSPSLTFGMYYSGLPVKLNETESRTTIHTENPGTSYTAKTYSDGGVTQTENYIGLLFGFKKNMALKIGFFENLETTDKPFYSDFEDRANFQLDQDGLNSVPLHGSKVFGQDGYYFYRAYEMNGYSARIDYYQYSKGFLIPTAEFGMAFNLGFMKIEPKLSAALGIKTDRLSYKVYYEDYSGGAENGAKISIDAGVLAALVRPVLSGDVAFAFENVRGSASSWGFSAGYLYAWDIYTGRYAGTQKNKGSVSWKLITKTGGTNPGYTEKFTISEKKASYNTINTSVYFSTKVSERIDVMLSLSAPFKFDKTSEYSYKLATGASKDELKNTETKTLKILPAFSIGTKMSIVPARFMLNLGGQINMAYSKETKLDKPVNTGGGTYNDSQTIISSWESPVLALYAGFTIRITENASIDALISENGSLPICGILFTLKF